MSGNHNMNQKPVAWFHEEKYKTHFTTDPSEDMIGRYWQPLYTAPLTVSMQEPVGEVLNERGEIDYISYVPPVGTPLYAAPQSINDFKPDWDTVKAYDEKFAEMLDEQQRLRAELKQTKRRWVGLTDEEVNEFYWISALTVEAIEAKLKEKNT